MLGKKEVPAADSQKRCLVFFCLRLGAVFSLLEVDSFVPWLPGAGKKLASAFWEDVLFLLQGGSGARSRLPGAVGREREGRAGHRQQRRLLLRANPRGTSFRNNLPWGLWVSGPVAPAPAFQDAPKWRSLLCVFQQLLFDSVSFVHSLLADGRVEELLLVRIPVKNGKRRNVSKAPAGSRVP